MAERDGMIMGYAYAGVFKDRAAYERSAETSIYVDVNEKRHGREQRYIGNLKNGLRIWG